jgi:hypothetical protein
MKSLPDERHFLHVLEDCIILQPVTYSYPERKLSQGIQFMTSDIYSPVNSNLVNRRMWHRLPRRRVNSSPLEIVEVYFIPLQRRILQQEMLAPDGSWSARFRVRCNHLQLNSRR